MIGNVAVIHRRVWRQTVFAGLTGLFIGSLFGCALIISTNRNSPVVVHEERGLNAIAVRNGHLDLYIDLDRVRDCPSETSRWLWTWTERDGERIKQFYPLINTTTTLSDIGRDQHFILSIPVPPGIWAGDWFYLSKTFEHCSMLPHFFRNPVRESSSIPVRITSEVP